MNNIFTIARKNGSGAINWSEDQQRYIIHDYVKNNNTIKNIAKDFNVRPESIRNLLRKNNILITDKKTKDYPRNSMFFNNIDTEDKAYWLGIFYADGNVSSEGNTIQLNLKDEEHVEKFRNAIMAKNKITTVIDNRFTEQCLTYHFSIRDSQLHSDLIKYGVLPRKSYLQFNIPKLDDNLMPHFIRGYFDGDGGLFYSNNKTIITFTGNKQFLDDLKSYLKIDNVKLEQNIKSKITYCLRLTKKDQVNNILNYMYLNSSPNNRLDRKYNLFLSLTGASPLNQ